MMCRLALCVAIIGFLFGGCSDKTTDVPCNECICPAPAWYVLHPEGDTDARWSAAGDRVVLVSTRSGNPDIWIASPMDTNQDGVPDSLTDEVAVTEWPTIEVDPCLSPSGDLVAFFSSRKPCEYIRWIDLATRKPDSIAVAVEVIGPYLEPCWSPDGAYLAYLGWDASTSGNYATFCDVVVVTRLADTRSIPFYLCDMTIYHLRWLPDLEHLSFVSNDDGLIYTFSHLELNTSGIHPVDTGGMRVLDYCWSGDGRFLAFSVFEKGKTYDIYLKDLNKGTITQVTNDPADDRFPWFSPNGELLIFSSNRSGAWRLWVCKAAKYADTAATQLTHWASDFPP